MSEDRPRRYKESVIERNERLGTDKKIADFRMKMQQPYEFKKRYAEIRAREFYEECGKRDLNCHVSVGGLDSIALLVFLRKIGELSSIFWHVIRRER